MKNLLLTLLPVACAGSLVAQVTTPKTKMGGYCDSGSCTLGKDHPAHFDPYYNGHLCENFNPKEADYSTEYLRLQANRFADNPVADLSSYDLSPVLITVDGQQNGVIGLDYTRIRIHISHASKDPRDRQRYHVKGKSNVKGNICDFSGEVRLMKAYATTGEYENAGIVFASYTLNEDSTQKHVGTFQGILEAHYYLDGKTKKAFLDESAAVSDGYYNRTYVGTWKGYQAKTFRKCIWGDYRLPFTFDFDCGDGAMIVCERYARNGWASFNDGSDFEVAGDKVIVKDKWWIQQGRMK